MQSHRFHFRPEHFMLNTLPKKLIFILSILFYSLAWSQTNRDVETEIKKLVWQQGPTVGNIGAQATIQVPTGYVFLDESNTSRFLELTGNLPQPGHYLFAPIDFHWWSVFSFNASGYVKDDEKIDAEALLKSLKDSDGAGNEERKRRGMEPLFTDSWAVAPHYDDQTKRLEWGVKLRSGNGHLNANYTSRLLGRSGVMSATLVSGLDALPVNTGEYKTSLEQFNYVAGEKYSEFKKGDKVAEYGLAALILGGAAAVATKKGLWGAIGAFLAASWKLIAAAIVAGFAALGKLLFKRNQN